MGFSVLGIAATLHEFVLGFREPDPIEEDGITLRPEFRHDFDGEEGLWCPVFEDYDEHVIRLQEAHETRIQEGEGSVGKYLSSAADQKKIVDNNFDFNNKSISKSNSSSSRDENGEEKNESRNNNNNKITKTNRKNSLPDE